MVETGVCRWSAFAWADVAQIGLVKGWGSFLGVILMSCGEQY